MSATPGLPIEQFIQALTSQLDRVQSSMALKMHAGLPLTFAVKDLTLDLRAHVEMAGSVVRIRPAEPGEQDASTLRLAITTITRPMVLENVQEAETPAAEEPTLKELIPNVTEDEQRRLEWAGIYNASQLREVERQGGAEAIQRVAQLPVGRLRRALELAAQPHISRVIPEPDADGALLRIHGVNLAGDRVPRVRIDAEDVPVLSATDREVVVRPSRSQFAGTLALEPAPGAIAEISFDVTPRGGDGP